MSLVADTAPDAMDRPRMDADIVCVGFGPAAGGFLTKLAAAAFHPDGSPALESPSMPGLPLQVMCYERADDIGFGVSGVVTRAKSLRESFPGLDPDQIPMAAAVTGEKIIYLLDPVGVSRRSFVLRAADKVIRALGGVFGLRHDAIALPWIPPFLNKHGGLVLSMGQFTQWVGSQVMATGAVQIWPGSPVREAIIENQAVTGVRLLDQGVGKDGSPAEGFMPGMEVRAPLTVVADGPVGAIGQQLDLHFGVPEGHHLHDWALGMKFVVDLPDDCQWEPGTVLHTLGFPEPEIFGFLYVHPGRVASMGIFIPSWFDSPVRTAYRYLQHWMMHPYLWRHLKGGRLRSWGAKTLQESGRRGEPLLTGDGFARIGEGSGSTNVLTNSGVDEAWATGVQLADAVIGLIQAGQPFTRENLDATYVKRRRESWVGAEGRVAEKARDGFQRGVVTGLFGTMLAGLTKGVLSMPGRPGAPHTRVPTFENYYAGRISKEDLARIRKDCDTKGIAASGVLMDRVGWPEIPFDGELLVSHQDALLMGGKVQAPAGYGDHVGFLYPEECESCESKICVEMCSGQAITPSENGRPIFDREKCIHCGACLWNCAKAHPHHPEHALVGFQAGAGGLHSAEN
jgi:electron-transferring-flavoprotein dehydrogenase